MKKKSTIWFLLLVLMGIPISLMAQGPVAVITVEGLSPYEIEQNSWTSEPSTGLNVVGIGELVYLSVKEDTNEVVTAYSWSITSAPGGSSAVLDSIDKAWTTFRPDISGEYVIRGEITTATGTAYAEQTIVAAEYVGVGLNFMTGGSTAATPQCGSCHSSMAAEWVETGHASMYSRAIDGLVSDHYASYCVGCHTTGFNDNGAAVNDGFDDRALADGWVLPSPLDAGNWDSMATNFSNVAEMANIQCESCHGPGSLHNGNTSRIAVSLESDVCGKCHEDAPHHVFPTQWKMSKHATGASFARGAIGSCASCHSAEGFISNGAETGTTTVTCQTCHNPHDATNDHQIRKMGDITLGNSVVVTAGGYGKLCMNCHKSRRDAETYAVEYHDHYGPHHGPQADMLAATNVITWGKTISSGNHLNAITNSCVGCHMSATPAEGEVGHNMLGEHTWNMHYDNGTPENPDDDVDNVSGCTSCHGVITSFDDFISSVDYDGDGVKEPCEDEIDGMMEKVALLLPPKNEPTVEVSEGMSILQYQAAYNYRFVEEDKSHGLHNYKFAANLLMVTLDTLTQNALTLNDNDINLPKAFELKQNFPNPFNPTTTIRFGLPFSAEVAIRVYNMLGQEVITLTQKQYTAGYHNVVWDGKNKAGQIVPSGLYIYRLESKEVNLTGKMILLK